jgi:hypothetical protein
MVVMPVVVPVPVPVRDRLMPMLVLVVRGV